VVLRATEENQAFGLAGNSQKESSSGCARVALKHIASSNTVSFANRSTSRIALSLMENSGSNVSVALNGIILTARLLQEILRYRMK